MGASAVAGRLGSVPVPRAPPVPVLERFDGFAREADRLCRLVTGRPPADESAADAGRNMALLRTVFTKWTLEILELLYGRETLGFEEIRRLLGPISSPVLSRKLRFLQENGLLERTVLSTPVIRVKYSLAPRGRRVAQLSEPVLLYLRLTDGTRAAEERFVPRPQVGARRSRSTPE